MTNYYCPRCGAMLAEDFLETAGAEFDCPECDQRVHLEAIAPAIVARINRHLGK